MKYRPIIFSAPMVRAILDGRKTQTRRVISRVETLGPVTEFKPSDTPGYDWIMRDRRMLWNDLRHAELIERCPHGETGDRLWVRETFSFYDKERRRPQYQADLNGKHKPGCWKQSIHMPRWASRMTLEITGVRVERLQEVSEDDAKAEGLQKISKDGGRTWKYGIPDSDGLPGTDDIGWPWHQWNTDPRKAYAELWNSINADRGHPWDSNPWVWVIEFKRAEGEK